MSVLDTEILGQLQDILVEPNDGGLTWPSGLWTAPEVVDYLNQRQRRFLQETQAIVARATQGIVPAVPRQILPQDWIATRRVSYQPTGFDLFNGLVSFWRLLEGAGFVRADSIGSNHLADAGTGVTSQAPGKLGEAAGFVAASGQLLATIGGVGSAPTLNPNLGNFTVAGWVYPATFAVLAYKGATNNGAGFIEGYAVLVFGNLVQVLFGDSVVAARIIINSPANVIANSTWSHVLVAFSRASGVSIYVNNVLVGSGSIAGAAAACNPAASFAIGGSSNNLGVFTASTDGSVDAVGYWSRILTADERAALYNGGLGRELYPAVRVVTPTGTTFQALSPGDQFEMDNFEPTWATSPQTRPWLYSDADPQTLEVVILPPSLGNGTLHLLYVQQPTTLTGAGVAFSVPDEFVPTLKWGALEDMLSKVGRAHDPIRAKVAGDYYSFGVEAAKALLQGFA